MKPIGMPSFNKISFDKPPLETPSLDKDSLEKEPAREVIFGDSKSAQLASEMLRDLYGTEAPLGQPINYVLVGTPNAPQGGLLERFPGLQLPPLNLDSHGTAPPTQYDGLADFPQQPLGWLRDLNQMMGLLQFADVNSPQNGGSAQQLPKNDAVTISAEAQAAADLLDPVS